MDLLTFGWNDRSAALGAAFDDLGPLDSGRLVRCDRGGAVAATAHGLRRAVSAGRLDPRGEPEPPAVGDWVLLEPGEPARIRVILPRTGVLARRRPGGGERAQVAAANVDLVLVVEGLDRGPNPRRIERAVALAWEAGAAPLVVLTKTDLGDVPAARAAATAAAPFADVLEVCATCGTGMEAVRDRMAGRTGVLLGPSGAGKSTLANALLGDEHFATGRVRSSDARGRHTTTHRELVPLPSGGCLIDTPGVRELGLWLDGEAVEAAFADIAALAGACRFRDCRHDGEPGCAVRAAVDAGELADGRLDSYHRLTAEAAALDRRNDPLRRAKERAWTKSITRGLREVDKHKGR